jgi:hypothetical protein
MSSMMFRHFGNGRRSARNAAISMFEPSAVFEIIQDEPGSQEEEGADGIEDKQCFR